MKGNYWFCFVSSSRLATSSYRSKCRADVFDGNNFISIERMIYIVLFTTVKTNSENPVEIEIYRFGFALLCKLHQQPTRRRWLTKNEIIGICNENYFPTFLPFLPRLVLERTSCSNCEMKIFPNNFSNVCKHPGNYSITWATLSANEKKATKWIFQTIYNGLLHPTGCGLDYYKYTWFASNEQS